MTKKESNKAKIVDLGGQEVSTDQIAKKPGELNFVPHPNVIFAVPIDETKTKSGIILMSNPKTPSPIVQLMAVGENVSIFKEGDYVYVDSSYIRFAEIDNVKGVILMQDGIFGTIPAEEINE